MKSRLPVLQNTLSLIDTIEKKRVENTPMDTHVEIGDNLYARATVPPTDTVALWLGADVLLEYAVVMCMPCLKI
jgi:hypothetical protein